MIRLEYIRRSPSLIWTASLQPPISQLGIQQILLQSRHSQTYTGT